MSAREPQPPLFRFFAAERSYFSGKVRPALRAKRIFFEEVLCTPQAYQEILRRTGLLFIPIVVTPEDDTWQDTSEILDALDARVPEPALIPASPVQRVLAFLIELYADEFLLLPAMHYRWGTPEGENDARGAFAALSGNRKAAMEFADRMSGTLPALGVTAQTGPAIAAHLDDLLRCMESLFADQGFLLGPQMSLADCAMMGPFYGHLYLDRVPSAILRQHTNVSHWIERMNHPQPESFTGFLAADSIHPSMHALLELIGQDAVPLLLDGLGDFESWADRRPTDTREPPRAVGFHQTRLRGIEISRYTSGYTLWMVQRSLDAYRTLEAIERRQVDSVLQGTGCEPLFQYEPKHRLTKQDFKLVFEEA